MSGKGLGFCPGRGLVFVWEGAWFCRARKWIVLFSKAAACLCQPRQFVAEGVVAGVDLYAAAQLTPALMLVTRLWMLPPFGFDLLNLCDEFVV